MIPSLDVQTPKETFEARAKELRSNLAFSATITCLFFVLFIASVGIMLLRAITDASDPAVMVSAVLAFGTGCVVPAQGRSFVKELADYLRLMAAAVQNHWL